MCCHVLVSSVGESTRKGVGGGSTRRRAVRVVPSVGRTCWANRREAKSIENTSSAIVQASPQGLAVAKSNLLAGGRLALDSVQRPRASGRSALVGSFNRIF